MRPDLDDSGGVKEHGSMKEIMAAMTKGVRKLEIFPLAGASVSLVYRIQCDYYYVYVEHNYFFYRIDGNKVIILEMFHEKEDFMRQLFEIVTTSQDTIDYWDE